MVARTSMNRFSFVSPSDAGLGLFARGQIQEGQIIGEYGGPRLPDSKLKDGTYAMAITNRKFFVDGNWDNCPRELDCRHILR